MQATRCVSLNRRCHREQARSHKTISPLATYAICDSVNLEAALAKAFVDKSPDSLAAH